MSNIRFMFFLSICTGMAFGGALYMLGGLKVMSRGPFLAQATVLPSVIPAEAAAPAQEKDPPPVTEAEQARNKLRQNLVIAHTAFSTDICNDISLTGFVSATQAYFERFDTEIPRGRIADLIGQTSKARKFWLTQEDLEIRKMVDAAAAENLIVSGDFTVPLDDIILGKSRILPASCRA